MIPSREEIEKAVGVSQNVIPNSVRDTIWAKSILLSFAEAYLAIDEPKEQEIYMDSGKPLECEYNDKAMAYNLALADYRLWLMKKCEGIEKIIKSCQINIGHHRYIDIIRKQMRDSCNVDVKDLTQAIQSHLLGEEKKNEAY